MKLAALFSHHMVLQREMQIPVWGWAEPGSRITVELAGHSAKATAGADGKWMAPLPALAAGGPHTLIHGDTVVVSSPQVSAPVAVRYGWADNPPCNLYNKAGLPASPFRTDDFPQTGAETKY